MPANQQGPLLGASYMTWIHMRKSWNNKFCVSSTKLSRESVFQKLPGKIPERSTNVPNIFLVR